LRVWLRDETGPDLAPTIGGARSRLRSIERWLGSIGGRSGIPPPYRVDGQPKIFLLPPQNLLTRHAPPMI